MVEPIAFLSYTHFDDQHEQNKIAGFCLRLSAEVRMQTGVEFPIFLDKKDIQWGQRWRERIDGGLDGAVLLIPVVTPSYFHSDFCRDEYQKFLKQEQRLGRRDLILPVYYVDCDEFDDKALREANPWARDLFERQYADWRELRFESAPNVIGQALARLAKQIKQAMKTLPPPVPSSKPPAVPEQSAGDSVSKPDATPSERPATDTRRNEPPTHIVDAMHRGHFTRIGAAVAAAKPGDRILIRPGLYPEGIVIDKPLEIIGDGQPGDVVLEATGKNVILFQASMGMVRNLCLRQMGGGDWYGVDIAQGRLVLEDCDITSQSLTCVAIHDAADPVVRRNRIHDGKRSGVFVYENGRGTLEDNDIFGNAMAGLEITEGADPVVRRNRIHDGKSGGVFVYENGRGTLEDNEIFGNALAGLQITTDADPVVRRNRIHDGKQGGVLVNENGRGTLEDNDIFGNAHVGVEVREGGNPTMRRNRINKNSYEGIWVHTNGTGTFEDNDLRDNALGAWDIEKGCEVKRARNQES